MEQHPDLITQFKASGLTQEAFCNTHSISIEKLRYYLYKKNKKLKTKPLRKSLPQQFISFPAATPRPAVENRSSFTVVHGQFTIKELSDLFQTMRDAC